MTEMSGSATAGRALRAITRLLAYPVLLVAVAGVAFAGSSDPTADLGLLSMLFLFGTIAYLALLERAIPYNPAWNPDSREWRIYGLYFLFTMLAGAFAQLPAAELVGSLASPSAVLPLPAEMLLALLLGSLGSYIVHWFGHHNGVLWSMHGVHHTPDKVNVGNNGVNNILDVVIAQTVVQTALALAGFSQHAVFAVGLFVIAQGYFVHANIDVHLGPLNYVVAGPEQHRLHHSIDLDEAGHYGSDLSIWDLLFGTFTWHPGRVPVQVGLAHPGAFPATESVLAAQAWPLRRNTKQQICT